MVIYDSLSRLIPLLWKLPFPIFNMGFIVANRPGTPGTVPDLEALSWVPHGNHNLPGLSRIFKDIYSDRSWLSSFVEGHFALASVEQCP